jgi:subtilisin family serine protease
MTIPIFPILKPISIREILNLCVGCLWASILGIAPIIGSWIAFRAFQFVPSSFSALGIPPASGLAPDIWVGICATFFSFSIEIASFFLPWLILRRMKKESALSAILLCCALVSLYQSIWGFLGLVFPKRIDLSALLRVVILLPPSIWLFFRFRKLTFSIRTTFQPTYLIAFGSGCLILIPWMVLGALGSHTQTLIAFMQASSYGVGEEILLRGMVPLLIIRFTGRVRLGWIIGYLLGILMQPGYFLPLGDWVSLFRTINAIAIGLLATELAVRGGLFPAILVHTAFEFGTPGFVDSRLQFSLPHPAALESIGVVCAFAFFFWFARRRIFFFDAFSKLRLRWITAFLVATLSLTVSFGAWFLYGHPGFTEDGFLIIFRQQANLDSAQQIPDHFQRVAFVYRALTSTSDSVQSPLRHELDQIGAPYHSHYLINMIEVEGHPELASRFQNRPEVAQIVVNPNVRVVRYVETLASLHPILPSGSSQGIEWNILSLDAPKVWEAGVTGEGIVVASADSGVDWTHPAIQTQYRGWKAGTSSHAFNWLDAWDGTETPWDDNGHGTHTVGTMVGDDRTGNQIGMAPGAQWIACRNMRYGIGNPGAYITCMEFFLAPYPFAGDPLHDGRPELSAEIVNNSWGCPEREGCAPDTLRLALRNMRAAGILMIAAAGNDGPACQSVKDPPGNDANVFTIGALDSKGALTNFSSKGPAGQTGKPDVVAPGAGVRSSIPGGLFAILDGTSMASPHVVGLVALLWAANPSLIGDIPRTEDMLRRTATPLEATGYACRPNGTQCFCGMDSSDYIPNNEFGSGQVNAWKAYREAVLSR